MLVTQLILFVLFFGSLNAVISTTPSPVLPGTEEKSSEDIATSKNRYFNILLRRRSHTAKEFYAYVDLVRGMHMDPKKPKFKAEVVRVLLNMKLITVKNPSKTALKFFRSQRDVVDMVTEEEKDIEAEL